ncbi:MULTISPECIES: hypothetical protein [unclassified Cedecea]
MSQQHRRADDAAAQESTERWEAAAPEHKAAKVLALYGSDA